MLFTTFKRKFARITKMKIEKVVHYTKPEHSEEEPQLRHHRFEIFDDGDSISGAEVYYRTKPMPYYEVRELWTEHEYQGKGLRLASKVMDEVEDFLIERKKPGLLVDAIHSDIPEVETMYERRGWELIDNSCLRAFNLPDRVDPDIFIGYEMRGVKENDFK